MRVLIVDDNALVRGALSVCLRPHYEVETAVGVDEALELVATRGIDVVITDVDLGDARGRDGLWLLDRLSAAGTAGFALTGHPVQHSEHRVLRKPATLAALRATIELLDR